MGNGCVCGLGIVQYLASGSNTLNAGENVKLEYCDLVVYAFLIAIADVGDGKRSCMCTTLQLFPPCDILYRTLKEKVLGDEWGEVQRLRSRSRSRYSSRPDPLYPLSRSFSRL